VMPLASTRCKFFPNTMSQNLLNFAVIEGQQIS
jgi:hypothetical protein